MAIKPGTPANYSRRSPGALPSNWRLDDNSSGILRRFGGIIAAIARYWAKLPDAVLLGRHRCSRLPAGAWLGWVPERSQRRVSWPPTTRGAESEFPSERPRAGRRWRRRRRSRRPTRRSRFEARRRLPAPHTRRQRTSWLERLGRREPSRWSIPHDGSQTVLSIQAELAFPPNGWAKGRRPGRSYGYRTARQLL